MQLSESCDSALQTGSCTNHQVTSHLAARTQGLIDGPDDLSVTVSLTRLMILHQNITEACCHGDHISVPDCDLVAAERHLIVSLSLSLSCSKWHLPLSSPPLFYYSPLSACSPPPPPPLLLLSSLSTLWINESHFVLHKCFASGSSARTMSPLHYSRTDVILLLTVIRDFKCTSL